MISIQPPTEGKSFSNKISSAVITTDEDLVDISIWHEDYCLCSTQMAPYNGSIRLCRLRDLIEDYMRGNALIEAQFSLRAGDQSAEIDTIFCAADVDIPDHDKIFLSQLPFQHAGLSSWLYLAASRCQDNLFLSAQFWTSEHRPSLYESELMFPAPFESWSAWGHLAADIELQLRNREHIPDSASLRSITARCGQRSKTWFFSDRRQSIILTFRNCFNATESLSFNARIKSSVDADHQSGIVDSQRVEYFSRSEIVYEVESEFLTAMEAEALQWALSSPVLNIVSDAFSGAAVISDISTEIDNDDAAERKVKFSFRTASTHPQISESTADYIIGKDYRVFTHEFTPPFL